MPSASEVVEAEAAPLDQSGLATGKNGLAFWWSNQLPALEKAAGGDLQILRFPSKTGKLGRRQALVQGFPVLVRVITHQAP